MLTILSFVWNDTKETLIKHFLHHIKTSISKAHKYVRILTLSDVPIQKNVLVKNNFRKKNYMAKYWRSVAKQFSIFKSKNQYR